MSLGLVDQGLQNDFSDRKLEKFALGVVGDLHLEPSQMQSFNKAAQQLRSALTRDVGKQGARLVQLGDLGGYNHKPGSVACFEVASAYLQTLQIQTALVTGNHDLEGADFETDEENLAAWQEAFGQRHYWAADLGPALCLGLSTVRFRSNKDSVHEVYIDEEQLGWFRGQLEASEGRPVLVFTHAPPMGCGLKVVEGVHVKNRCAWLNHSDRPEIFLDIVRKFPNIRLWFSGHYHLSQNYPDSIATVGSCAFIQTGVIGDCDRDGFHQSRLIRGDLRGYQVCTLDHSTGEERVDIQHSWSERSAPKVEWLSETILPQFWPAALRFHQRDTSSSATDWLDVAGEAHVGESKDEWHGAGKGRVLRRMGSLLVEYNAACQAAVGVVFTNIDQAEEIRLVDSRGQLVNSKAEPVSVVEEDGSRAVAVELVHRDGSVSGRVERNSEGGFFQIFQKNKWRIKKAQSKKDDLLAVTP